jgi:hypothetical protein
LTLGQNKLVFVPGYHFGNRLYLDAANFSMKYETRQDMSDRDKNCSLLSSKLSDKESNLYNFDTWPLPEGESVAVHAHVLKRVGQIGKSLAQAKPIKLAEVFLGRAEICKLSYKNTSQIKLYFLHLFNRISKCHLQLL